VERTQSHSVRFRLRDVAEVADILVFLSNYDQELQP